ncbi:MAG: hypothetical protein JWO38_6733 [Gemmataceae bacterium]|nr:hypothetical protein [Gemmataceae bacterium]
MGVRIVVADGEPIGVALRRFKVHLERQGVAREQRWRAYFVDPTQTRRAKRFQKRFKARRATIQAQEAGKQPIASLAEATAEFWRRTGKP